MVRRAIPLLNTFYSAPTMCRRCGREQDVTHPGDPGRLYGNDFLKIPNQIMPWPSSKHIAGSPSYIEQAQTSCLGMEGSSCEVPSFYTTPPLHFILAILNLHWSWSFIISPLWKVSSTTMVSLIQSLHPSCLAYYRQPTNICCLSKEWMKNQYT